MKEQRFFVSNLADLFPEEEEHECQCANGKCGLKCDCHRLTDSMQSSMAIVKLHVHKGPSKKAIRAMKRA